MPQSTLLTATQPRLLPATPEMTNVWDTLVQFDAADSDKALNYLLEELCRLVNGTSAFWVGALRINTHEPNDPLLGWRPRISHRLDSEPSDDSYSKKMLAKIRTQTPDPSLTTHVRMAGSFRAYRLSDIVDDNWYQSPYYLEKKAQNGVTDRLYVVTPLNEDMECYFSVDRVTGQPMFSQHDCQLAATLLRSLGWFQRQVALSHGLQISTGAITPSERRVLQQLLTSSSEREIARKLEISYNTVHSYVSNIYRKFDVNGRAGLMALWLGQD
ncbi:response regulator transcription factor [Gilvimarinus sp. 1_MG-2023]|uniref:response regulator transcription factor n=1 Tax=Gilvimarinus sp. 1_MG-2023 TaxID=3062638 RepID=UPI0026E14653|nr:helix-turn-helix transcriptional regulator [Gilvimarinus sp. 1_MG-2023]MDO6748624.1 helix-turn-helix transcriptional regulator [Gilvimarinus sp. 1_MG-2023]